MNGLARLVTSVVLICSGIVFSAGGVLPGAGTQANPYLIEDLADFDVFANSANGDAQYWASDAQYWASGVFTKLMCDIDLSALQPQSLPEPAAHWKFDETEGDIAFDSSSYERNGTLINGPVWTSSGKIGGALQFDGVDDYVEVIGYKGITGTADRSVCGWIKTGDTGQIIAWGDDASNGGKWEIRIDGAHTLTLGIGNGYIKGITNIMDNNWHHIAVVFANDGTPTVSDVKLYVDGQRETMGALLEQTINTVGNYDLQMGINLHAVSGQDYFNGTIDDVRVYDSALTGPQIRAIIFELPRSELAAHWKFDETEGDIAFDSSSYERNGTLINGPVWTSSGKIGGALQFDGDDDYVEVAGYKGITGTADRSVCGWIKTGDMGQMIAWGDDASNGGKWEIRIDEAHTLTLGIGNGYIKGITNIMDNNWHHIAVVFANDGTPMVSDVKLYVDGIREMTGALLEQAINTVGNYDLQMGINLYALSGQDYFNGTIDDVWIYDNALTAEQIAYLAGGRIYDRAVIAPDTGTQTGFQGTPFSGNFNGNGHVVQNLTINNNSGDYLGLFGGTSPWAVVENLGLENVNITGSSYIGCLAGWSWRGTISNCNASGRISGYQSLGGLVGYSGGNYTPAVVINNCWASVDVTGRDYSRDIGGLVGFVWGGDPPSPSGAIRNCYATGNITAGSNSFYLGGLVGSNLYSTISYCWAGGAVSGGDYCGRLGGLVGDNYDGTISNCYAEGAVSMGDGTACYYNPSSSDTFNCYGFLGGLVGRNSNGIINNCWAGGDVTGGNVVSNFGGLVGGNGDLYGNTTGGPISNCYATGAVAAGDSYCLGGLVGGNCGEVSSSFWDKETSGRTTSAGGTGKTTAEMKTLLTFTSAGWDFVGETANGTADYWRLRCEGMNYPKLSWQIIPAADFVCPDDVNIEDLMYFAYRWLMDGCTEPNNCDGADLNIDGKVDIIDFDSLSMNWSFRPPVAEPELASHWKFDETGGYTAFDSSRYRRYGTLINGPVWTTSGKIAGALQFDGTNDYVKVTGYKGITGTVDRSVCAWIKTSAAAGPERPIVAWGAGTAGSRWNVRLKEDATFGVSVYGGNISTVQTYNDGLWHHVAAVLSSSGSPRLADIKLYVDGVLKSATITNDPAINTALSGDVIIGSRQEYPPYSYFNGTIDDVRIYDVALTEEKIFDIAYGQ